MTAGCRCRSAGTASAGVMVYLIASASLYGLLLLLTGWSQRVADLLSAEMLLYSTLLSALDPIQQSPEPLRWLALVALALFWQLAAISTYRRLRMRI